MPGNRGSRLWAAWRALFWHVWKRIFRKPLVIQLVNGMKLKAYPDCVESSLAFYVRWPDRLEIDWLRQNLQKGERVVDIGANIGLWSLLLADVVGPENILAIEAGRVAAARLRENFSLNGMTENQILEAAAGDRDGEVEFPDCDSPDTNATALADMGGWPKRKVPLVRLDTIFAIAQREIGFVKIDVEGSEPGVLRGMTETLKTRRVRIILFESFGGKHLEECKKILSSCGYSLSAERAVSTVPSSPQNHFAFRNQETGEFIQNLNQ